MRARPDDSLEKTCGTRVCGIDEAGRGPWAGPVVAAAVILSPSLVPSGIDDSKKLTASKREALYELIIRQADCGVGIATAEEIDALNIWGATKLAMQRAVAGLSAAPDYALVDGKLTLPLPCPVQAIISGDSKSLSIAAASIIAKVTRDRIMKQLHREFPHYGWQNNAGYGTAAHIEAIRQHGISPHHRRSFKPIRDFLGQLEQQTA